MEPLTVHLRHSMHSVHSVRSMCSVPVCIMSHVAYFQVLHFPSTAKPQYPPPSTPPCRVRRALENTALPLAEDQPDSVLTYGRGMMQVDKAWQLLQRMRESECPDVRYEVAVQPKGASGGGSKGRGVYLRHHPGQLPCCFTVTVWTWWWTHTRRV